VTGQAGAPFEVLVLCTANICRSPIAEAALRAALQRRLGDDAPAVTSAGTHGWEGWGATTEAIRAARELGVAIDAHLARALHDRMVDEADLVVTMAAEHRDAIMLARPEATAKTFTIKELVRLLETSRPSGSIAERAAAAAAARNGSAPADIEDVRDPLGDPIDGYREVAAEIHRLSDRLADLLAGEPA
jgi:protein-tyrosine phosphatase